MSFLNSIIIFLTIMIFIYMYNECSVIFPLLIPFLLNVIINIISCAYIEEGIYVADINKYSYMTGSTIRLALLNYVFLFTVIFLYKINKQKILRIKKCIINENTNYIALSVITIFTLYLLVDILISGSIISNSNINRFNYYSDYSTLPLISLVSSLRYSFSFLSGLVFISTYRRKYKFWSCICVLGLIISWYLVGNQFTGILYVVIYFFMPILILLLKSRVKLINFKNVSIVIIIVCVALLPKLSYFQNNGIYGLNNSNYNSAFSLLLYRAFGLQSALWWEIDRQVFVEGFRDFSQISNELLSLFSSSNQYDTGIYYLMEKGMPQSEFIRYIQGNGTLCAGHPGIEIVTLGYIGAAIMMIFEAVLFFFLIKKITICVLNKEYFSCLIYVTLLYEGMKVFTVGGFLWLGNTIPKLCILYLLFKSIFKIKFKIRLPIFKFKN